MLRYYIMADLGKTLNELFELNEDEKFYKDYFEVSASSGQLKKFLDKVDLDDAIRRHLIIPELLPDIISYEMNDDEYFKDNDRNVFISKHNRYTPPFLHKHDFFEIIFVFTGHCSQTISTTRKDFTEGDLIFIAPGVYHTMEVFDDNSIVFNILLRKSTFSQMFIPLMKGNNLLNEFFSEGLYHSQQIDYVIFHSGGEHLIDSQKEMLNVYHEHLFHDAFSDQVLVGMLTQLSAKMMRHYRNTVESSYRDKNEHQPENFKVMHYMQSHLEDVTLQDIADHFGFSLSYCSRLIKSTTGQSFNDWKRLLRIQKAERLLVNTQKSVADISEILGYENPETFIRAFKKELHITPAKYRRREITPVTTCRKLLALTSPAAYTPDTLVCMSSSVLMYPLSSVSTLSANTPIFGIIPMNPNSPNSPSFGSASIFVSSPVFTFFTVIV